MTLRRLPRLPFWLIVSLAITLLFMGTQDNLASRLGHNCISSVILLAISLFYNGRFGFMDRVPNVHRLKRTTRFVLRVLGIFLFALGIFTEIAARLPQTAIYLIAFGCAISAPIFVYFSYINTSKEKSISEKGRN